MAAADDEPASAAPERVAIPLLVGVTGKRQEIAARRGNVLDRHDHVFPLLGGK